MSDQTVEEILDTVNRCVLNFFDNNKFSAESMNTWETALHQGKDCTFRPRDCIPQHNYRLQISIMVFKEHKTIIINCLHVKGGECSLIESAQISRFRIDVDVRDRMASALTRIGLLSLPQLLQIRLIRNIVIDHLDVGEMLHLEATCKLMRDICSQREIDQSFWRKKLKRDFGKEKEDIHATYREAYKHELAQRKNPPPIKRSLLIDDPLRDDRFAPLPRRPAYPDPMWPDPSIPNPFAPGYNPNGPFFGGPGTGPEMMPSRPSRFPGAPRGPPSMGPSGWPQFDRSDFI